MTPLDRIKVSAFLWLCCIILTYLATQSYAAEPSTEVENPPAFFRVFSQSGDETFAASCAQKTETVVKCDFEGMRVNSPSKNGEHTKFLRELEKLQRVDTAKLNKDLEQIKSEWKNEPDHVGVIRAIEERIKSSETGPETRTYLREFLSAYRTGDVLAVAKINAAKELKTCSLFVHNFSLTFKKIGPRKWLHETGPSGLCNLVKVYELEKDETHDLWTMKETRGTAGRTDKMCEGIGEELGKVTTWTWKNPSEFELPCDFIKY